MVFPIRTAAELPKEGHSHEHLRLEFKGVLTEDSFEIAKDVAAFSNAEGGTILIGAKGNGEYLAEYAPISTKDASNALRTFTDAVKARCSPPPLVEPHSIDKDGGKVLAMNVHPFPGQLVGVEIKKGEAKCGPGEKQPEGLFYFPLRIGAQTTSIPPEQIPMFIDPRVRRIAIALADAKDKPIVIASTARQASSTLRRYTARVTEVDIRRSVVAVSIPAPSNRLFAIKIPFDVIEAAWHDGTQGEMVIRGRFHEVQIPGPAAGWAGADFVLEVF